MESVDPVEIGGNARKFLTSPRLAELNKEFEQNGGEWKEFKIGELFDIHPTKAYKLTNADLLNTKGKTPVVSNTSLNNGIIGFSALPPTEQGNIITYSDTTTSDGIFYQPADFIGYPHIQGLYPHQKNKWFEKSQLYFVSLFRKSAAGRFDYANKFNRKTAAELAVTLPAISDGTPDFSYMERYIGELEQARVSELEQARVSELAAYLRAAGLENYDLTAAEQTALDDFKNNRLNFKKFKIGELFDIHPTKAYKLTNANLLNINGKTPVVSNTSLNNGIIGFSALPPTEQGNIITYSDTTTSDGIFYQPADFIGYPHIQGLYPHQKNKWFEKSQLYFVSLFRKSAAGRFDYTNKFNRKTAAELAVTLPAISDGAPDFAFMESFITAQQKLAIRDVVQWKDKVISETRKVANV